VEKVLCLLTAHAPYRQTDRQTYGKAISIVYYLTLAEMYAVEKPNESVLNQYTLCLNKTLVIWDSVVFIQWALRVASVMAYGFSNATQRNAPHRIANPKFPRHAASTCRFVTPQGLPTFFATFLWNENRVRCVRMMMETTPYRWSVVVGCLKAWSSVCGQDRGSSNEGDLRLL